MIGYDFVGNQFSVIRPLVNGSHLSNEGEAVIMEEENYG